MGCNKVDDILLDLQKNHGFDDARAFTIARNDLRPLLSGEGGSAKELSKKYKQKYNKQR